MSPSIYDHDPRTCKLCTVDLGGGVDNSSTYPQPGDKVVDNVPDVEPWEGDDEVRETYLAKAAMGPFGYSLYLETKLGEARRLIQWFSLKYGENNPVFNYRDPMSGSNLEANRELSRTWFEVVRHGFVCLECEGIGAILYETGNVGVQRREICLTCEGRGYKTEGKPEDVKADTPPHENERKSPNGI
jgi:hypothetical protein